VKPTEIIKELKKYAVNLTVTNLDYWERLGLVSVPHKKGFTRRYSDEDSKKIIIIVALRQAYKSMNEIKVLLGDRTEAFRVLNASYFKQPKLWEKAMEVLHASKTNQ